MRKPNVLGEIISFKKLEVEKRKKKLPLKELEARLETFKLRGFRQGISSKEKPLNLIAEVKKASPSKGLIRPDFDLEEIVGIYNKHAQAISVITEEKFFQGKLEYLERVREASRLPVLRKDFILDEYQVFEAKAFGADAILLIAAALAKDRLKKLFETGKDLGLDCLVEIHSGQDLEKALAARPEIIGINNRNLETLETDLSTTEKLLPMAGQEKTIVSESGFHSAQDLESVKGKVDAVLIGTAFMKEKNIEAKLFEMGF